MDFRSLIGKLEKIEQRQLLQESTNVADQILSEELQILKESYINLMERLNYKVLQKAEKIDDEAERMKFLGAQAAKNGYPGLFDPVTGKFVDSQGQYAWFGAYKSEVEQMERDGLIPEKARTEALLGLMGKEHDAAYSASQKVANKDKMIDDSNELMAKGKQSYQPLDLGVSTTIKETKRGSLAQSITESFGYTFKQLAESITREEHKRLKNNISQLQAFKDDEEVARVLASYDEYVKIRGLIISKIEGILQELQKLRGTALKESREMLREEIYLFGNEQTREVTALTLYYDTSGNLVEYSAKDLGNDISDVGRGAGQALTFGYSDNAVAVMKSLFKGTSYAEELKKELQATDRAKQRSPYLYGAGWLLGNVPYFVTGGAGFAIGAAGTASDILGVRDKHNLSTLMNKEKEDAAKANKNQNSGSSGSAQKPAVRLEYNPEVKKIQDIILQKDPKALPKYGADGKLGPETLAAAKRLGIALPGTPVATPEVDPAVSKEIMAKLGASDSTSAVTAFNSKVKANGGDVAGTIAQLAGLTPAVAKESITFSSMTEQERMSYLLNKMTVLEGYESLGRPIIRMLELATGKGTEAVMAALVRAIPKIATEGITLAGETWKPVAGVVGKFSNGKGAVMEAEQILHYITNTSTVGDTVLFAGKNYQKTASGWVEAGKAKVLPKAEQAGIEKEWAKVNGKDPHAPAPKGPEVAAEPKASAADAGAATAGSKPGTTIPSNKVGEWVQTKYPKLYKVYQYGKVPVKWATNNKWWAALAALVAWGYIWPGVTDDTGSEQKPDVNANPNANKESEAEKKRQEQALQSQLDALVKMLQEMFPDDQETADILAKVKGDTGSDQKADTGTESGTGWDPNWTGSVGGTYKLGK